MHDQKLLALGGSLGKCTADTIKSRSCVTDERGIHRKVYDSPAADSLEEDRLVTVFQINFNDLSLLENSVLN